MPLQDYLQISASRIPDKVAVTCNKEAVSYRELDELSNELARRLLELGVTKGDRVGLYQTKSIDAVVSIFGVLKAGCGYVPLDVDSPVERTSYIIQNCILRALITDGRNAAKLNKHSRMLSAIPETGRLCLSLKNELPPNVGASFTPIVFDHSDDRCRGQSPKHESAEGDLAYILYTSGSTGNPKGVMLSHGNAEVFVDWAVDHLSLNEQDVFSSHAPFHFDLSVFDIFASIKSGGTLCLLPPGLAYFADAIRKIIADNGITIWYSVPSALIRLLSNTEGLKEDLACIRKLIYAGEVFNYPLLTKLRHHLTECDIINWYGPTETNVITTYRLDKNNTEDPTANLPIGTPCPYADICVVDDYDAPVNAGATGELIVKGASLMMGYWDDPEKTSRSIRTLREDDSGEPYYFTGDLVCRDDKGLLYYVNRRDHMVKTRGFRVELGEIETALHADETVTKAAVVPIPDNHITHRLYAFVELSSAADGPIRDIINNLGTRVPAYMVPEQVFAMDRLPLTSTGKIDRRALMSMVPKRT
ncbi:MAG: amino acid adenylation domain-containing protein [Chitinivibrionales bacterium]|nr:amino acid adenylation domain-containing protein [Chitinivibrionales bacterium]MBD3355993.1 amino acid adenylation domain-containing protein [Chitinivibrionales bacterium]